MKINLKDKGAIGSALIKNWNEGEYNVRVWGVYELRDMVEDADQKLDELGLIDLDRKHGRDCDCRLVAQCCTGAHFGGNNRIVQKVTIKREKYTWFLTRIEASELPNGQWPQFKIFLSQAQIDRAQKMLLEHLKIFVDGTE